MFALDFMDNSTRNCGFQYATTLHARTRLAPTRQNWSCLSSTVAERKGNKLNDFCLKMARGGFRIWTWHAMCAPNCSRAEPPDNSSRSVHRQCWFQHWCPRGQQCSVPKLVPCAELEMGGCTAKTIRVASPCISIYLCTYFYYYHMYVYMYIYIYIYIFI